jgi:hypothetical protein
MKSNFDCPKVVQYLQSRHYIHPCCRPFEQTTATWCAGVNAGLVLRHLAAAWRWVMWRLRMHIILVLTRYKWNFNGIQWDIYIYMVELWQLDNSLTWKCLKQGDFEKATTTKHCYPSFQWRDTEVIIFHPDVISSARTLKQKNKSCNDVVHEHCLRTSKTGARTTIKTRTKTRTRTWEQQQQQSQPSTTTTQSMKHFRMTL